MYYRFVDGWLTSLSALGQGLAAMTVVVAVVSIGAAVVVYVWWSGRSRAAVATRAQVAVEAVAAEAAAIKAATDDSAESESLVWSLSPSPSLSVLMPMEDSRSGTGSWQLSDDQSDHSDHRVRSGPISSSSSRSSGSDRSLLLDPYEVTEDGVEDSDDSEHACSFDLDGWQQS
jgi:type II secretory pathway pseudopilin PulG